MRSLRHLSEKRVTGVIDYPRLALFSSFRASAVIICDVERMPPDYEARIADVTRCWAALPHPPLILNAPPKPLRRYELLKKLFKLGVNKKDIHRLDDPYAIENTTFPCFIRDEAGHHLTPDYPQLLNSRDELLAEVENLRKAGLPTFGKIIVEFEDTRDDTGMYCKYAYFRVADNYIPGHMFWNPDWFVKFPKPGLLTDRPDLVERERNFIETSPHKAEIDHIFNVAGIDFGRIDYGVRADGGIHVFEINTNPNLANIKIVAPERKAYIVPSLARLHGAFEALAEQHPCVKLQWPKDELIYRLKSQI